MAFTLSTRVRDAMCDAGVDEIDVGAGSNGTLEIGTSGMAGVIVALPYSATAFGASSSGVATAATITATAATLAGTNTAAEAQIKDADGTVVMSGLTVGTSGSDINLSNTSIELGMTIDITSQTMTMPAS